MRRTRWLARGPARGAPPAQASSPQGVDPADRYLADLLSDTREELSRVDSKASLLLAAVGLVLGTLISGVAGTKWSPLGMPADIQWLWWLGVAAAAGGVLAVAASVHPRIGQPTSVRSGVPAYYADVAAYKGIDEFRAAIERAPQARERLLNQTFWLSALVRRKYALVRYGLWCLLAAVAACTLSAVISILLGS